MYCSAALPHPLCLFYQISLPTETPAFWVTSVLLAVHLASGYNGFSDLQPGVLPGDCQASGHRLLLQMQYLPGLLPDIGMARYAFKIMYASAGWPLSGAWCCVEKGLGTQRMLSLMASTTDTEQGTEAYVRICRPCSN